MVRIYEQVDVVAIDGSIAACTGFPLAQADFNREVQESGSLGSGTLIVGANTISIERALHYESEANEPNETSWPAGDWVVRFNVTTGNTNLDITDMVVCRVDSGGTSQATIGAASFLPFVLSAGVKSITVAGGADAGAAATDRFYLVGGIRRILGHGSQQATITNDQLLDTPFAALAGPSIPVFMDSYRRRNQRDQ